MKPVRLNTLVVDTSVFSKRPSPAEIKVFLDNKLHLDMSHVKRIQLHTIKNVVYLGMRDMSVANRIATDHHLRHRMMIDGKEPPILVPVYVESSATDVRLHDLPEEIDTTTIIQHMSTYGEVISVREELWKNFWPGFSTGVIVCRMRLARHIPSFINFDEFEESATLCTYKAQIRTCFKCNRKAHPKQRCSEAAEKLNSSNELMETDEPSKTQPSGSKSKKTKDVRVETKLVELNDQSFPALPNPTEPVIVAAGNVCTQNKEQAKNQNTAVADTAYKRLKTSDMRLLYSLDQKVVYDELMRSDRYTCFADPEERKRNVWLAAGSYVEDNKRLLAEKQQQKK